MIYIDVPELPCLMPIMLCKFLERTKTILSIRRNSAAMFPLSCERARVTFRLARTAFLYWRMLGTGLECYCSQSRPMCAQQNKIRGNIALQVIIYRPRHHSDDGV